MDAAALSRSLLEESGVEADLARMARVYLQKARALLLERHRAGAGGREIDPIVVEDQTGSHRFETVRQVFEPAPRKMIRKAYADNFKYGRIGRWTH